MTLGKPPGDDPRPLPRRPALMSVEPSQSRGCVGRRRTTGKRRTVSGEVKCLPWWCGTGCCPFLVWNLLTIQLCSRISKVSWMFEQSNVTQHRLKHICFIYIWFHPVAPHWVKVAALGCFSLHWCRIFQTQRECPCLCTLSVRVSLEMLLTVNTVDKLMSTRKTVNISPQQLNLIHSRFEYGQQALVTLTYRWLVLISII